MKQKLFSIVFAISFSVGAMAQDFDAAALEILSGAPLSPDNCFFDTNGDGVRDGTVGSITLDQVRAVTGRADVVALATTRWDAYVNPPPRLEPTGIEAPYYVSTNGAALQPQPDGGVLVWQAHDSPWNLTTNEARRAAAAARYVSTRGATSNRMDALNAQYQSAGASFQSAVSNWQAAATGWAALNPATCTSYATIRTYETAQKTVIGSLGNALRDMAQALRDLAPIQRALVEAEIEERRKP